MLWKKLASNRQITIKPADKGSGVVILNTNDYIREAFRQLSDISFYQALDTDLTSKISSEISRTLLTMRNDKEIGKKCLAYLLPNNPRPGRFYLLPKIHKGVLLPPGRPIVSAIGSPTEKISEFLDFFLQPLLSSIPSFVKDTGHFFVHSTKLRALTTWYPIGNVWCSFALHQHPVGWGGKISSSYTLYIETGSCCRHIGFINFLTIWTTSIQWYCWQIILGCKSMQNVDFGGTYHIKLFYLHLP